MSKPLIFSDIYYTMMKRNFCWFFKDLKKLYCGAEKKNVNFYLTPVSATMRSHIEQFVQYQ